MASPFSGANRELGRDIKAGIETAFAEVNAAGGIHGRTLRLVALDDGYEPSRTGPAMKQLVEKERVFAVVGNVGTPTAAVAIPYCMEKKVIFFGALSGGDLLRKQPARSVRLQLPAELRGGDRRGGPLPRRPAGGSRRRASRCSRSRTSSGSRAGAARPRSSTRAAWTRRASCGWATGATPPTWRTRSRR